MIDPAAPLNTAWRADSAASTAASPPTPSPRVASLKVAASPAALTQHTSGQSRVSSSRSGASGVVTYISDLVPSGPTAAFRSGSASLRFSKEEFWQAGITAFDRIEMRADLMGGLPIVCGTRIPAFRIVAQAARGLTVEQIVEEFDGTVNRDDVEQALAFAASLCR